MTGRAHPERLRAPQTRGGAVERSVITHHGTGSATGYAAHRSTHCRTTPRNGTQGGTASSADGAATDHALLCWSHVGATRKAHETQAEYASISNVAQGETFRVHGTCLRKKVKRSGLGKGQGTLWRRLSLRPTHSGKCSRIAIKCRQFATLACRIAGLGALSLSLSGCLPLMAASAAGSVVYYNTPAGSRSVTPTKAGH